MVSLTKYEITKNTHPGGTYPLVFLLALEHGLVDGPQPPVPCNQPFNSQSVAVKPISFGPSHVRCVTPPCGPSARVVSLTKSLKIPGGKYYALFFSAHQWLSSTNICASRTRASTCSADGSAPATCTTCTHRAHGASPISTAPLPARPQRVKVFVRTRGVHGMQTHGVPRESTPSAPPSPSPTQLRQGAAACHQAVWCGKLDTCGSLPCWCAR